ncbi:MAG: hypothetical protein AB8G05_06850 [Oligoflexales bacterium]
MIYDFLSRVIPNKLALFSLILCSNSSSYFAIASEGIFNEFHSTTLIMDNSPKIGTYLFLIKRCIRQGNGNTALRFIKKIVDQYDESNPLDVIVALKARLDADEINYLTSFLEKQSKLKEKNLRDQDACENMYCDVKSVNNVHNPEHNETLNPGIKSTKELSYSFGSEVETGCACIKFEDLTLGFFDLQEKIYNNLRIVSSFAKENSELCRKNASRAFRSRAPRNYECEIELNELDKPKQSL